MPRGRNKEWNVRSLKGCTHGEDGEDGRNDMWARSEANRIALQVISSGSYFGIVRGGGGGKRIIRRTVAMAG